MGDEKHHTITTQLRNHRRRLAPQIVELLGELNPETRSAHCPECGDSQLIFTELVYMHHKIADATHWWFGGDGDIQGTNSWRVQCSSCSHVLRTATEANGFEDIAVVCDGEAAS